jgi:hypothetical protein
MASRPTLISAHANFPALFLVVATAGELPAGADAGRIPWGLIGLGVGLPLLLFALWLLAGPVRGCDQLGGEWTALQSQREAIRESFEKAATNLDVTRAARVMIEEQIAATGSNGGIDEARDAERTAEESLANWRGQLDEATAKADAARRAYEQCLGKAVEGSSS